MKKVMEEKNWIKIKYYALQLWINKNCRASIKLKGGEASPATTLPCLQKQFQKNHIMNKMVTTMTACPKDLVMLAETCKKLS